MSTKADLTAFQRRILRRMVALQPGSDFGRWCTGPALTAARHLEALRLAVRGAPCRYARTELGDAYITETKKPRPTK